jgi:GNAT superfamily N-acetyltransferase
VLIAKRADGHRIDTDPHRLDIDLLHHWLSTDAYWALGRSRGTLEAAIAHSINYGLYSDDGGLIGFARAVTDRAVFAYLCDVYLDRAARGAGLGTWLVATVCDHLTGLGVRRILLTTQDAHRLYAKLGFTALPEPDRWMQRQR